MDYKIISDQQAKRILEKYWEGESSLVEEAALRDYFQHANLPLELQQLRPMFLFFSNEQAVKGEATAVLSLDKKPKSRPMWKSLGIGIAASIMLAIASIGTLNYFSNSTAAIVTIKKEINTMASLDAEQRKAYEDTKAALLLVSSKLNKGKQKAMLGLKHINK